MDKNSERYKTRRMKNNISVRKCRENSKIKKSLLEKRIDELEHENRRIKHKLKSAEYVIKKFMKKSSN